MEDNNKQLGFRDGNLSRIYIVSRTYRWGWGNYKD